MALAGKNLPANTGDAKRHGFNPWVRKISWRRKWRPSPEGEFPGQRSLVGCSPRGHRGSDTSTGARIHTPESLISPPVPTAVRMTFLQCKPYTFTFLFKLIFYWRIVALQCCGSPCGTATGISHMHTRVHSFFILPEHQVELPVLHSRSSLAIRFIHIYFYSSLPEILLHLSKVLRVVHCSCMSTSNKTFCNLDSVYFVSYNFLATSSSNFVHLSIHPYSIYQAPTM